MRYRKLVWWLTLRVTSFLWGSVGSNCYVGRPAYLRNSRKIFLGRSVRIYPNARLECGRAGRIIFGDNISIGPNLNITSENLIEIGSGTTISANVFITDMDHDISNPAISVMDAPNQISTTFIGKNCFIGAGAVILAGTRLEAGCVVGANATVRGHFEANVIIVGSPARAVGHR